MVVATAAKEAAEAAATVAVAREMAEGEAEWDSGSGRPI